MTATKMMMEIQNERKSACNKYIYILNESPFCVTERVYIKFASLWLWNDLDRPNFGEFRWILMIFAKKNSLKIGMESFKILT